MRKWFFLFAAVRQAGFGSNGYHRLLFFPPPRLSSYPHFQPLARAALSTLVRLSLEHRELLDPISVSKALGDALVGNFIARLSGFEVVPIVIAAQTMTATRPEFFDAPFHVWAWIVSTRSTGDKIRIRARLALKIVVRIEVRIWPRMWIGDEFVAIDSQPGVVARPTEVVTAPAKQYACDPPQ